MSQRTFKKVQEIKGSLEPGRTLVEFNSGLYLVQDVTVTGIDAREHLGDSRFDEEKITQIGLDEWIAIVHSLAVL